MPTTIKMAKQNVCRFYLQRKGGREGRCGTSGASVGEVLGVVPVGDGVGGADRGAAGGGELATVQIGAEAPCCRWGTWSTSWSGAAAASRDGRSSTEVNPDRPAGCSEPAPWPRCGARAPRVHRRAARRRQGAGSGREGGRLIRA
jgi:hypothetical protein